MTHEPDSPPRMGSNIHERLPDFPRLAKIEYRKGTPRKHTRAHPAAWLRHRQPKEQAQHRCRSHHILHSRHHRATHHSQRCRARWGRARMKKRNQIDFHLHTCTPHLSSESDWGGGNCMTEPCGGSCVRKQGGGRACGVCRGCARMPSRNWIHHYQLHL